MIRVEIYLVEYYDFLLLSLVNEAQAIYLWLAIFVNSYHLVYIVSIMLTIVIKISDINFALIQNGQYYKI